MQQPEAPTTLAVLILAPGDGDGDAESGDCTAHPRGCYSDRRLIQHVRHSAASRRAVTMSAVVGHAKQTGGWP